MRGTKAGLLRSAALGCGLFLGACGGGGGINSTPTPPDPSVPPTTPAPVPTPTPTPTPTSTPAPTATNSDTREYRATVGAVSMNALAAYNRGATGLGIGVGVIDSGIDLQSEEFGSRISTASTGVAGNTTIDDEGGHGTAVAFTLAGRRNGTGTHGVAFDSTLIVLRADRPGTCVGGTTDDAESGCKFFTDAIARGVDTARTAGAKVINISLGGSAMPQSLKDAVGRATLAGIIVVIAAGNDGTDNPDPFTDVANDSIARNMVIIAGSVGAGDTLSTFSDKAGMGAAHFLTAVGERVPAPDNNGANFLWSGTSFAAPQISGAVALLAQAFPNLSGAQIVDILFKSARDAGAAGVDAIYGNGVLDLTRAFQPLGTTSVAGSRSAISFVTNGMLSAPMGDAAQGSLGAVVLDGYARAFATDLAPTIGRSAPSSTLGGMLQSRTRAVAVARGGMTASVTLVPKSRGFGSGSTDNDNRRSILTRADVYPNVGPNSGFDAGQSRAIAATMTQRLGETLSFGLGVAQGSTAITAQLTDQYDPAFLVATMSGLGFDSSARASSAVRQRFGGFGVTAGIETGDVLSRREADGFARTGWRRSGYERVAIGVDRQFGAVSTYVSATRMSEQNTFLGARLDAGLGAARAASWFADAKARLDGGDGWSIGGSFRQGWSSTHIRGGLNGGGMLHTRAFAADIGKAGLFGADSIGLRIAQPLRVTRGGINLALPTAYDYATSQVTGWTTQRLNLTPSGRQLDIETRYGLPAFGGGLETNLFLRHDPGNFANIPTDYGLAVRFNRGF